MYFFITAIKICYSLIRPTETKEKMFLQILLKFVIKKLRLKGNLAPAGGTVRWDMS